MSQAILSVEVLQLWSKRSFIYFTYIYFFSMWQVLKAQDYPSPPPHKHTHSWPKLASFQSISDRKNALCYFRAHPSGWHEHPDKKYTSHLTDSLDGERFVCWAFKNQILSCEMSTVYCKSFAISWKTEYRLAETIPVVSKIVDWCGGNKILKCTCRLDHKV